MKIRARLSQCMGIGEGDEMLRSMRNDQIHTISCVVSAIAGYLDFAL